MCRIAVCTNIVPDAPQIRNKCAKPQTANCCSSCHDEPPDYLCNPTLPDGREVACCCKAAKHIHTLHEEDPFDGLIREMEALLSDPAISERLKETYERSLVCFRLGRQMMRLADWHGLEKQAQ